MIERNHYSPRSIDDHFSVAVFNSVINEADPQRLLFTDPEFKKLLLYKTKIDDELQGNAGDFFEQFSSLFKKGLTRADSILNKLLEKTFDFTAAETIGSSRARDSFAFAADVPALANRWSRYLKYRILDQAYDDAYESDESTDEQSSKAFRSSLTSSQNLIKQKIKKAEANRFHDIMDYPGGYTMYLRNLYLNAIATCFDPHTNYFSPQEKDEFKAGLSTEDYFFGIILKEENGKILVDKLTPGGPAWKSGEINKGDELVSLLWEGMEVKDMTGATLEEAWEIIDRPSQDKLLFRLKKPDGTVSMVMLRKEKISNEDNIVKSFILKGEKKIGYILLPGFYTDWENEQGSSCANDVAKEILKLKKDNVEGLILDVRYNGGGSMKEAMDLAGIFIDEGAVGASKSRDEKLITLRDPNRGTIFDGPLALMVNGQSASASEMLAASLQDYHRAVIVGSNTYGKATIQVMFPMDTITSKPIKGDEKTDIVKITIGKLYRVNGQTAQLVGVKPDILLPDAFDGLEMGERFERFALIADTVKRNNYYKPLAYLPIAELSARSTARLYSHPQFTNIRKIVAAQQKQMLVTSVTIPLKADLYEKWVKEQEPDWSTINNEKEPAKLFVVENHSQDKQVIAKDLYAKEMNNTWLNNLAEDFYIQEVFMVLTDLINIQKATPKN